MDATHRAEILASDKPVQAMMTALLVLQLLDVPGAPEAFAGLLKNRRWVCTPPAQKRKRRG